MKAILFLFLVLLLSSCTRPLFLASDPEPTPTSTIVRLDSLGQLSAGKIKFNGPVTVQIGQGNVASTTKTDNTGRAASSGANGGQSSDVTKGMPLGMQLVLVVVAMVAGVLSYRKWWPGARVATMLLLLLPLGSQAHDVSPPRYTYRQARMVERRYNKAVRYYNRKNRRDNRELRRDRKVQIKRLRRDHP